jgi:hypothetical protein
MRKDLYCRASPPKLSPQKLNVPYFAILSLIYITRTRIVIPAKAGIQSVKSEIRSTKSETNPKFKIINTKQIHSDWIPAFAGMTELEPSA